MKKVVRLIRIILRYSPIKLNIRLFRAKRGRPPNSGFKRFRYIWFAKEDFALIKLWATEREISIQSMAHTMVTQFLLCKEKNHEAMIETLTADRNLLYSTLGEYVKRFGKIEFFKPETLVNQ